MSMVFAAIENQFVIKLSYNASSGRIDWDILLRGISANEEGRKAMTSPLYIAVYNNGAPYLGMTDTTGEVLSPPQQLSPSGTLNGYIISTVLPQKNPVAVIYIRGTGGIVNAIYAQIYAS